MGRSWISGILMVLASGWASPGSADSSHWPATIHRIVAIGDLHGDFSAWRDIARAAGLIDAQGHWRGGQTELVQTGDVVDRGPDGRRIIADLMQLQREAKRAGGRVIALVGNHEAMNMQDDLRYVSPADFASYANAQSTETRDRVFAANREAIEAAYRRPNPQMTAAAIRAAWIAATPLGQIEHQRQWHAGGPIGQWIMGNPAVVLIDGTLFLHGGLSSAFAAIPLAEINRRVAVALQAQDTAPHAITNDPDGPLWYRGYALGPPGAMSTAATAELAVVLKATGAARMVIGHTPLLSGIAILDDGRLVRIDTGISAAFGGVPSYLEILDGKLVPHAVTRSITTQETH